MDEQREFVEDWGKPILPKGKEDIIEKEIQALNQLSEESPEWRLVGSIGGFKYYMPKDGDLTELRCWAEGTFDFSLTKLVALLGDKPLAKKLDPNVDSISTLEEFDYHNKVTHIVMKSMYFTAPRDVVSHEHWQTTPDGTMYRVSFATEHELAPPSPDQSKRVRALVRSCARLKPDPTSSDKCSYRIYCSINVRLDMVPKWIQRTFGSQALKMNAQNFAVNLDKLHKLGRRYQTRAYTSSAFSHIALNNNGKLSDTAQQLYNKAKSQQEKKAVAMNQDQSIWEDVRFVDVAMALVVASSYFAAILLHARTHVDM